MRGCYELLSDEELFAEADLDGWPTAERLELGLWIEIAHRGLTVEYEERRALALKLTTKITKDTKNGGRIDGVHS